MIRPIVTVLLVLGAVLLVDSAGAAPELESRLMPLIEAHRGQVAITSDIGQAPWEP